MYLVELQLEVADANSRATVDKWLNLELISIYWMPKARSKHIGAEVLTVKLDYELKTDAQIRPRFFGKKC